MLGSVALAAGNNPLIMVNPLSMVADVDGKLRGSNLFAAIMTLATSIAVVGFFVKIYAAVGKNVMSEIRGVLVQGIGVAIMLSLSGTMHSALTSTWNEAYNGSNAAFAGVLGPKIEDAKVQMNGMIGTVASVSIAATGVGAVGGVVTKAGGEAVKSAALKGAGNVASKALSRISAGAMALSGFGVMYSGIIAIAAFVVMILGYLIPLVISFTMWGQVGPIWAAIGSGLGAIFVAAFLPMIAYSAIDLTFIRSAEQSQVVIDNSSLGEMLGNANAALAEDMFNQTIDKQLSDMQQCAARQQTDPTVVCNTDTRTAIQKAWEKVKGSFNIAGEAFIAGFLDIMKNVSQSILQVIFAALYFIISLVIMGAIVNLIVGILGGAASYVGAVAKGGG